MLSERLNIYEYEEILLGQKLNFTCSFKGDKHGNETEVGNIWRYAITKLLRWTPNEALKYLNKEIIKNLMLDKTYVGIDFDESNSFINDYRFVLQYAFPDEIKYDFYQETIDEYENVAKIGAYAGDKKPHKYQKKFFVDANGYKRARIILNYVIGLYLSDKSVEQLYDFFSGNKAKKWCTEHSLGLPIKLLYQNNILDYFHESYDNSCDFYYYNIKIREYLEN